MTYELSSIDLQEIIRKDEILQARVEGIFASDSIPHNIIPDQFYIINSDPSYSIGEHWMTIYFPKNSFPEFFDSLGKCPSLYSSFILNSLIENNSRGFIHNYKRLQKRYSYCCGLYCLFYIHSRSKNISFQDFIRGFSKNLEKNDDIVQEFAKSTLLFFNKK